MQIFQMHSKNPDRDHELRICYQILESIRWPDGIPVCPYGHDRTLSISKIKSENRYHCNFCFSTFSVLQGTIFHKTHCLPEWFKAIPIFTHNPQVTCRSLASQIGTTKNSANRILQALHIANDYNKWLVYQVYLRLYVAQSQLQFPPSRF